MQNICFNTLNNIMFDYKFIYSSIPVKLKTSTTCWVYVIYLIDYNSLFSWTQLLTCYAIYVAMCVYATIDDNELS